jgi:hypothetical protein
MGGVERETSSRAKNKRGLGYSREIEMRKRPYPSFIIRQELDLGVECQPL